MTNKAFDILHHQESLGYKVEYKARNDDGNSKDHVQILTFVNAEIIYATELHNVAEVIRVPEITSIPNMKDWMLGVSNFRGDLLPILDLGHIISGNNIKTNKKSRALVVKIENKIAGLIVEQVYGIQKKPRAEIEESGLKLLDLKTTVQELEFDMLDRVS